MEAKPQAGSVMPYQLMSGTLPYGSHCIGKFHDRRWRSSFYNTATREAHEAGMQICQFLHQILPKSMSFICISRHKGYESQKNLPLLLCPDDQSSFRTGLGGCQKKVITGVFLPIDCQGACPKALLCSPASVLRYRTFRSLFFRFHTNL